MSAFDTSLRTQTLASGLARTVRAVLRSLAALARSVIHRREVTALLHLDDRMLDDIGLVRADVQRALAEPIGRDASVVLRLRSVHHRARRRETEVNVASPARVAGPARDRAREPRDGLGQRV